MGTMINRRRVCGGKKGLLPSGYKQLEYIESNGTQYIDTGVIPKYSDDYEITFKRIGSINAGSSILGCRDLNVGGTGLNIGASSTTILNVDFFGFDTNYRWKTNVAFEDNSVYKLTISDRIATYYKDDVVVGTHTFSTSQTVNKSAILFGVNNAGSAAPANITGLQILYAKIGSNVFIPAKDSSNTIGMYDIASGTFFTNAGTGDFIAGPEV